MIARPNSGASPDDPREDGARAPRPRRRKKLGQRPEAQAQKAIIEALQAQGCIAIRVNSGQIVLRDPASGEQRVVRGAKTGTSDVIAGVPIEFDTASGRRVTLLIFTAIECKALGKSPTGEQSEFLEDVRRRGGMSIVARSLDDVERLLRAATRAAEATRIKK